MSHSSEIRVQEEGLQAGDIPMVFTILKSPIRAKCPIFQSQPTVQEHTMGQILLTLDIQEVSLKA